MDQGGGCRSSCLGCPTRKSREGPSKHLTLDFNLTSTHLNFFLIDGYVHLFFSLLLGLPDMLKAGCYVFDFWRPAWIRQILRYLSLQRMSTSRASATLIAEETQPSKRTIPSHAQPPAIQIPPSPFFHMEDEEHRSDCP